MNRISKTSKGSRRRLFCFYLLTPAEWRFSPDPAPHSATSSNFPHSASTSQPVHVPPSPSHSSAPLPAPTTHQPTCPPPSTPQTAVPGSRTYTSLWGHPTQSRTAHSADHLGARGRYRSGKTPVRGSWRWWAQRQVRRRCHRRKRKPGGEFGRVLWTCLFGIRLRSFAFLRRGCVTGVVKERTSWRGGHTRRLHLVDLESQLFDVK